MFTVQLDDSAIRLRFATLPERLRNRIRTTVSVLAEKLRTHIVRDKLAGQVLNKRTGALARSIQWKTEETGSGIQGVVYSAGDVKYAAIHEYSGRTPPHVIEAKNKLALTFMQNGKQVFYKRVNHPGSVMPERSFMRSALSDMRQEIIDAMQRAVVQEAQK